MSIQNEIKKITIRDIQKNKINKTPITVITAYDALMAKIFDPFVDMILVGDSLSMSFGGDRDTLSIGMDEMIYHTKAVCRGSEHAMVIFDMPFGSYTSVSLALENATRVYKETDAVVIKIEGGSDKAHIVKELTKNSIAVMGHIGLMPQYVRSQGGYIVRGKTEEDAQMLIQDALALQEAGAFAIVLEGIKSNVASQITQLLSIPTIGIGAGNQTDGQVLVWSDMFGFNTEFQPKFVRKYVNGASLLEEGIKQYVVDVKDRSFPNLNEEY